MKAYFTTIIALHGAAFALPAPDADPVRILPSYWSFNITSLKGPGCPDQADITNPTPKGFNTRPTYGMNTVDGSEIYYWHFAYPYMYASVGEGEETAHVWCETTLLYSELESYQKPTLKADYRLRLHKNGTRILAQYDLEEGVEVTWKFSYYTGDDDEVVDSLVVNGPRKPEEGDYQENTSVPKSPQRWTLPNCGAGTIKYRTDLYVSAKKNGASGAVYSGSRPFKGETDFYGAQQGISYDWEKCQK